MRRINFPYNGNYGRFTWIKASCTEHQKGTIAISLSPRPSTVSESSPICTSFLLVSRTRRCRLLPKALVPTTKKLTAWLAWYIISTCTTSPLPVLLLLCRFLPFMMHIDYNTVHWDSCFRCHWQTTPFQLLVYHVRTDCIHWPMLYTCDLMKLTSCLTMTVSSLAAMVKMFAAALVERWMCVCGN